MLFQKIQKSIIALGTTLFLLFFLGSSFLVLASEQSALEQKQSDLERIEAEWQKYQDQINLRYSQRIEKNKQRLYELRLELEENLQTFDRSQQDVEQTEEALDLLQERLTTLRGQLENLSRQLEYTESKVQSIEEQVAQRETRLAKVMEEKERIAAEANIQRNIVMDYFSLLQTESESFSGVNDGANGLRIILSNDSFTKNLRDEMHFTALEKTARQIFHDLEGAMSQLEEADYLLTTERNQLKQLHSTLEIERRTLAVQKQAQKSLFQETLGEEQRFQELVEESKAQMEESAVLVAQKKEDIDYIREQLNIFETQKKVEERKFDKEKLEELLLEDEEIFEVGENFLLQDQEDTPLQWPVEPLKITAYFQDSSYESTFGVEHNALDIRAAQGTEIRAPAAGYVYKVVDNGMGYSYIVLIHKNNLMTVYGHVSGFAVAEADLVQEGGLIGYTGGTIGTRGAGHMTTGPHLHFEVWENGEAGNPLDYLPLDEMQPEDVPREYLLERGE